MKHIVEEFSKPTGWFFHKWNVGDCEQDATRIAGLVNQSFPSRVVYVRPAGAEVYEGGQFLWETTYYVCMEKMEKGLSH